MMYVKNVFEKLEEEMNRKRSNVKRIGKLLKQLKEITKKRSMYEGIERKFLVELVKNRYEYKNNKKILKKQIVKKISYIIKKLEREGVIKKDAAGFWRIL